MPRASQMNSMKQYLKTAEFDNQHSVAVEDGYIQAFVAQGNPNLFERDDALLGDDDDTTFDPFDFLLYSVLGLQNGSHYSYYACIGIGPGASKHIKICNSDGTPSSIKLSQLTSIRFECLSQDEKELDEITVLDRGEDEVDDIRVKVSPEFVKRFKSLHDYTWEKVDIDRSSSRGLYVLEPESVGYGEGDGTFHTDDADQCACQELGWSGAWLLDQEI